MYLSNNYGSLELQKLKKAEKFYCPVCRSDLVLKAGQFKIPHFAHKTTSLCESFSEPESPLHLQGKLLLYEFFKQRNHSSELEKFLPSIKQRADVLVEGRLAVEFQCSTISLSTVETRTAGYREIGIETVWIHNGKAGVRPGLQLLKIKPYETAFFSERATIGYLLGLDPVSETFIYYSSLFYVGGNQWIGKVGCLPLSKQVFPFAVPKRLKRKEFDLLFSIFRSAREKFINQQLKARNRFTNPFWRSCYELSFDVHNLPSIIGIPLPHAELLPVHPVLWQLKAAEAVSQNHTAQSLLEANILHVQAGSSKEAVRTLLETYMEIYKSHEDGLIGEDSLKEFTYDYYCNIL